jgi:hypothetical protein
LSQMHLLPDVFNEGSLLFGLWILCILAGQS